MDLTLKFREFNDGVRAVYTPQAPNQEWNFSGEILPDGKPLPVHGTSRCVVKLNGVQGMEIPDWMGLRLEYTDRTLSVRPTGYAEKLVHDNEDGRIILDARLIRDVLEHEGSLELSFELQGSNPGPAVLALVGGNPKSEKDHFRSSALIGVIENERRK